MTLLLIVRYLGVALALVGAFAAAPGGTSQLCEWFIKRPWSLLRRRQPINVTATVSGNVSGRGDAGGTVAPAIAMSGENAMMEQRVDELAKDIAALSARVSDVEKQLVDVRQSTAATHNRFNKLDRDLKRRDDESTRTDSRALPCIGVGILLSALPDQIAKLVVVEIALVILAVGAVSFYVWQRRRT